MFCQVVIHTIRLPKQSTVGDVINDLKTKVILQFLAFQNWTCDSNFNQSYFPIPIVAIYQIHMHQKKEFKKKKKKLFVVTIFGTGRVVSSQCRTQIAWSFLSQDLQGIGNCSNLYSFWMEMSNCEDELLLHYIQKHLMIKL